jgi:hypothetical protein
MKRISASGALALSLALAAPAAEAADALPFTAQPVCGRVQLTDSGGRTIVLATDRGAPFVVDTSVVPADVSAALAVGQEVVVLASPGTEPARLIAHGVEFQTWQAAGGAGPWRCIHGDVLTAEGPELRVRLDDGNVVVVDRSRVVEDVADVYRGERVTVIGKLTALNPAGMLARYVVLDTTAPPWPGW